MTKSELINALAERTGTQKTDAANLLETLVSIACAEAKNGFIIPGLGKLVLVDRASRTGRNPLTGETIQIPARKAVKFRVAKACKDAILAQ